MASAAPIAEVSVDITGHLDKLLADFAAGKAASERFDRAINSGLGQSVRRLDQATTSLGASEMRLSRSLDQASRSSANMAAQMNRTKTATVAAISATETSMASLRRTLLASAGLFTAALGINRIREMADGYTSFTNRLRAAGMEGQVLARTQEQLFTIAQRYGVELESVGTLYGRISQASGDLGASTQAIMQTVEGAAAAVRVYGASTAEQTGAMRQLSQMLGNAKVQMQEFNSLNDGARPILQAVANGIDRFHGSVSALRAEVMRGGFDTREFFQGMQRGLPAIIEQANRMPLTIGASFQVLNNALGQYIGQTDRAVGATQRVGAAITALANNLDTIMPILTAIVLAIGARYVGALGLATIATIRKVAVDTAAALAANVLATSTGRVTTTLGVTTIATEAYAGSLGVVTLEANAATAGLTRMQIAMATAGAVARGVGAAMLSAFGGWVGLAIFAVVGAVILYNRRIAQARQEIIDFNEHQRNANQLLAEERQRAQAAGTQIQAFGQQHHAATGYVTAFAGATGDAADALHRQAVEARNARFHLMALAITQAEADAEAARTRQRSEVANAGTMGAMGREIRSPSADSIAAGQRAAAADATAARLRAQLDEMTRMPLEAWLGPHAATAGRDIAAEIANLQHQLVNATRAHNTAAMRELNKQIRIRRRITEFLNQGLSLEIANAQAEAEALGAAPHERGDPSTILPFTRPVPGRVLSPFGEQRNNGHFASGRPMPPHPHAGVDIVAAEGTPVRAPQAGFARRRFNAEGLGIYIEIDHGGGTRTRLAHLSAADVPAEGMRVEQGQIIGRTGRSGNAAGGPPHLHYERREGGRNVNPLNPTGHGDPASLDDDAERAAEERLRNDEAAARELQQLTEAIIQARSGQLVDAAEVARLERVRVNGERDREKTETEAKQQLGIYTDIQARDILAANENLRTTQLRAIDLREQQRTEQEAARTRQQTHDTEISLLQAQQDVVRTATERRTIERRILAAQKEYERQVLQATIDSPFTTPIERALAQGDMATLDRRYGAQGDAVNRQSREDLLGSAPEGSDSAHRQQMQTIREQEDERLRIVQEALDARIILEEEAARRRVEIEQDAQRQLREAELARQLVSITAARETADSLTEIAQAMFGEHSKIARAMFIVSKAFAIAEAVMKIQVALANALSLPFPANIPAIATVAAIGASIIGNIVAITAQFDSGGWTGWGSPSQKAGDVHGQEFVVRHGPAARHRPMLEDINAGRDPTARLRGGTGGMMGRVAVSVHNHAPGVEHEVRQIGPGEVEIIAKRAVEKHAPGVIAADMTQPNSRTSKALARSVQAPRKR